VPVNIISGNNSGVYVHINKYYKFDILQYTQADRNKDINIRAETFSFALTIPQCNK